MLSSQEQVRLSRAVQAKISLASLNIKVCLWARADPVPLKGRVGKGKGLEESPSSVVSRGLRGFRGNCPNSCVSLQPVPPQESSSEPGFAGLWQRQQGEPWPSFCCHPLSYTTAEPPRHYCNEQHLPDILFTVNKHLKGFQESVDYFHYFWFKSWRKCFPGISEFFFTKLGTSNFVPWTRVEPRDFKCIPLYLFC